MEDFEVLSEDIATVTEGFDEQTATCPELDLMSTIAVACSDERFTQWQEEVADWIDG